MKRVLGIALSLLLGGQLFAGGIDNKQNLGSRYMGEPTRNVAIDAADIAAFNPAGVMLGEEGVKISVDLQYILKTYEHTYTDDFQGKEVTEKQDAPSPIPNMFVTYKKDNWGLFGSLTANGGGGTVDYANGNSVTYGLSANFADTLRKQTGASSYSFDNDEVKAFSAYYTFTTGGSYQVNEQVSVALGARYIYASKSVEASSEITLNGGAYSGVLQELELEYAETAHGFGGVVSVDYLPLEDRCGRLALRSRDILQIDTNLDTLSPSMILTELG